MQRKPPAARGAFVGSTLGAMGATEAAGTEEATAAGEGESVPVADTGAAAAEGVVDAVGESVPVADTAAAAAEGVVDAVGESVPVADTGAAAAEGVVDGVGESVPLALALTPGARMSTCHWPPQAMNWAGQAVLPLCWQQVNRGCAALAGLK